MVASAELVKMQKQVEVPHDRVISSAYGLEAIQDHGRGSVPLASPDVYIQRGSYLTLVRDNGNEPSEMVRRCVMLLG